MGSRRLRWSRFALAALALVAALTPPAAGQESATGRVRGRLSLELPGVRLADAGPIVAFLEPIDGTPAPAVPAETPKVYQKDARFSPPFLVIAAGQSVSMPNDDAIYHNVFSYSAPNDFDLGLYPAGESRTVKFRYPGLVRTYCSIHESMSGTIFVAPTRHFAMVAPSGDFEIRNVAPGRYRLQTWCDRLPAASREIEVRAGHGAPVELRIVSVAP
jgi:plastocyanin